MHYENSIGHIGGNLSCIDALLVLHHDILRKEDVLILSKGHSAGALYVSLWSVGRIKEDALTTFHQNGTHLGAHPSTNWINDIKFATGSLGHGLPIANGIALASKLSDSEQSIYCLTSDGEWQEGSMWEALIFASHHNLRNLTILVDVNGLQAYGSTEKVASMHDLKSKLDSFDVVIKSIDGHDPHKIIKAIKTKHKSAPLVILLETVKGNGIESIENKLSSHYLPLTKEQFKKYKLNSK